MQLLVALAIIPDFAPQFIIISLSALQGLRGRCGRACSRAAWGACQARKKELETKAALCGRCLGR